MGSYRWHLIGANDKVKAVEAADCPTDAEAMIRAARLLEQHPELGSVEIWEGARLVGRAPSAEGAQLWTEAIPKRRIRSDAAKSC
jgi:hypothetical protein